MSTPQSQSLENVVAVLMFNCRITTVYIEVENIFDKKSFVTIFNAHSKRKRNKIQTYVIRGKTSLNCIIIEKKNNIKVVTKN